MITDEEYFIMVQRAAMHRLLGWLAMVGQGDIKGHLLEEAEIVIDDGGLDVSPND